MADEDTQPDPEFADDDSSDLPDISPVDDSQDAPNDNRQMDEKDRVQAQALQAQQQKEADTEQMMKDRRRHEQEDILQSELHDFREQISALQMENEAIKVQLQALASQQGNTQPLPIEPISHPHPLVFIAKQGSSVLQWQERLVNSGALANFTGGRKCVSDGATNAIITPSIDEYAVIEIRDPTTGCTRYVKIAIGATSRFSVAYVDSNRTMGGAYKGYLINASTQWQTSAINVGSGTFSVTNLIVSSCSLGSTDAEEVTLLNEDEEGQSTHAMTAATQIKHLVLCYDTGILDNNGKRIFVMMDSDSKACSGDGGGGF